MKAYKQVSSEVDSWIAQEELPESAGLKVVRTNYPDCGLTEDEIDERNEFIQWYLMQDFVPLLAVPKPAYEDDFFVADCTADSKDYSALNTHDFQDRLKPFNRYGYAMRKVMERVKDLAVLHSCMSSPEGRERTCQRYLAYIDSQFRRKLMAYVERYQAAKYEERKLALKQKIAEVSRRILEAKMIWERYAPRDS